MAAVYNPQIIGLEGTLREVAGTRCDLCVGERVVNRDRRCIMGIKSQAKKSWGKVETLKICIQTSTVCT